MGAALLAAAALTACGGASESDDVGPVANTEELLHKANIGEHEVTFVLSHPAGDAQAGVVVMEIKGPNTVNPLAELERTDGPMTFLEVLKAVAPNETPRPELVKTHAEQAKALGRADVQQLKSGLAEAGVRLQAIALVLPIASRAPCADVQSSAESNRHIVGGPAVGISGLRLLCVDTRRVTTTGTVLNPCTFKTPRTLVFGACVVGGTADLRLEAFRNLNDGNGFAQVKQSIIKPGTYAHLEAATVGSAQQSGAAVAFPVVTSQLPNLGGSNVYTATK